MERVVVGRSFTLSKTFYSDGTATTPAGTPTVTITRADGSTVTTSTVGGTGTGPYTVTVAAANNQLLDELTVTWTATIGGQPNTYVDTVQVAGDVLFTIAEVRALNSQLADSNQYSTGEIVAMRTTVEEAIEQHTGALVPRYHQETLSGSSITGRNSYTGTLGLRLTQPYVRAVRSITIDGVALGSSDLANVTLDGQTLYGYGWPVGWSNIVVGYEHGRDRPPERVRRAALTLAKIWLVSGPVDDRTNTFTSTEGGTFSLVTPGRGGSIFGIPEVDAAVLGERIPVIA